ncbi:phage portal protein [Paracoccaceae bacterium GXU_MW_L88]
MSKTPNDSSNVTVIKSVIGDVIEQAMSAQTDIGGEAIWPINPWTLLSLYRAIPEHGRAIQVKANGAFGRGLVGKDASKLNDLTKSGFGSLAVALGVDRGTYGNAFLQKIRGSGGKLEGLRRLPALTMRKRIIGDTVSYVQTTLVNGREVKEYFDEDEIIHIKDPCPSGFHYAYPSWSGVQELMQLAVAAVRHNASFFENGAMPEYAIIFKGSSPSKEVEADIKEFFQKEFRGVDNAHRTLVIGTNEETTIEIKKLTADVKDGDFIKLMDAARDRMPVAHGTPPRVLGIMSAGQLGGGGEMAEQLFTFEALTCKPERQQFMEQISPVLDELGLAAGDLEDGLGDNEVAFRSLDLTPPKDDFEHLPDLVTSGVVRPEEARAVVPWLQGLLADGSESAGAGAQGAISRSAGGDALDALAALLARS